MEPPLRTKLFGSLAYRPRWGITARGWLLLAMTLSLLASLFVVTIHPFLSITRHAEAKILVVEGWISPGAIAEAAREFRAGKYERLYVTGVPMDGPKAEYNDYAEQGYRRLEKHGLTASNMVAVVSGKVQRDRTYTSALALREYLRANSPSLHAINVFTASAHARRSHLLFRKAFGGEIQIGIIASPPTEYQAGRWWTSSSGVKEIISETAAYLYARLFFWP
jgi:uncharacterized SAM-binding protein YcdF (DUF218 family)